MPIRGVVVPRDEWSADALYEYISPEEARAFQGWVIGEEAWGRWPRSLNWMSRSLNNARIDALGKETVTVPLMAGAYLAEFRATRKGTRP